MLSKPVYESLPYLYLGCGFGFITFEQSIMTSVIGGLIFIFGAFIWNLRSDFRRRDSIYARKKNEHHPTWYQFKPFILFLAGVFIVVWTEQIGAHIAAYSLSFFSLWILMMRVHYRHFSRTLQAHQK